MRDRTADPLLAKQVLSQLSYTPISFWRQNLQNWTIRFTKIHNADLGLECLFVSWDLTFVMSCLVTLRCSVNNFCSSNLFRCLWQLLSLVLAGRYFRASRVGASVNPGAVYAWGFRRLQESCLFSWLLCTYRTFSLLKVWLSLTIIPFFLVVT